MPPIVQEHLSFVTVVLQNRFYKHMPHRPSFCTILLCAFAALVMPTTAANAQCEADHTIVMADYYFAPSELTIGPGETVAFINVQGTHNINGISNTLTGTSWENPVEFFLDETIGTEEGTCMGVIQFDVPGVYNFDSSIGFQAQLGMVGSITVDAFTIADMMAAWNNDDSAPQAWQSAFALQNYLPGIIDGNDPVTVFLPNDEAVEALGDLMNLNQFDLLGMYDMPEILKYHIASGVYLAEDLEPGMSLPTIQGQSLSITQGPNGLKVDGVNIVETNYTAFNGVVHIIDYGLAPDSLPNATVYQVIVESDDHAVFLEAVNDLLLNDDLIGQPVLNDNEDAPGHFTVFAPTDQAFVTFAQENGFASMQDLFDSPYFDEIIRRHIVEVPYESSQFFNNQNLNSYGGENIQMNVDGNTIAVENAAVVAADLMAYNGVVHVTDAVIDFTFPNPVGTCGTWTLNMYAPAGEGWDGYMQVLVDDVLVGTPTVFDGTSNSFAFAVNQGSTVDMNYVSVYAGWPGNFEVVDAEGTVLFDSDAPSSTTPTFQSPSGVYGLKACTPEPACGQVKVNLYSQFDGWDVGSIAVYDGIVLVDVIGGYWFNGQHLIGYVDLEDGSDVDFVVNQGYFSSENGYTVEDAEGNILVDETAAGISPSSATGITVCDATSSVTSIERTVPMLYPNPARETLSLSGVPVDQPWTLVLTDAQGRNVLSQSGHGPGQINLKAVSKGMYLAQVSSGSAPMRAVRLIVE